jgi:hypothetical protein
MGTRAPLYVLVQRPRQEALYVRCRDLDQCIDVVTEELEQSPARTRVTMFEKREDEEPRILKAWRVGRRGVHRYHINASRGGIWYHGGKLTGPVRPLYLTSSRAVAELVAGPKYVHPFRIDQEARWVDLGSLTASYPSMDSLGYDRRAIERLKAMGADVVIDEADFRRGHPQIFVLHPEVLTPA